MPQTSMSEDAESEAGMTRREWIQGMAALALQPDTGQKSGPPLLVAAAKRLITPDPLLPISGGMGIPQPAREKRGDLTARALYVKRGDTAVAIVGLDLIGFPGVLVDRVRARVPRLKAESIMVGSTHTHSAPDCYAFPDGKGGHTGDLAYIDRVCTLAAEAINEAIDRAQPARIRVGTEEAQGKIAYNYYAPDLYDRRMSVLQALTPDGKTIATLVNYAIHPEVLGNDLGILSPDLCGPLYERIETQAGGMALFMNGAQGGMVTADNRSLEKVKDPQRGYWEDERTWEECLRIGGTMADEALRIIAKAPVQESPGLFLRSILVTLPVSSPEMWQVVTGSPLRYPHGKNQTVQTRLTLVNLGDTQILTIPGEALPNIGFFLKRKMQGKHNLLFGLTNDAFGYILTEVDFHSFPRYEYVSRTSLGEQTCPILTAKWLELIKGSPRPDV